MRKFRSISAVFILLLIWEILAVQTGNDIIMPYPIDVFRLMVSQLRSETFYLAIASTFIRAVFGLICALFAAMVCAWYSYRSKVFEELFYPILLLTRSIPNVSYIIIILLWFGREKSSAIITFLILFPIMYANLSEGFAHIDKDLIKVIQIYPEKQSYQIRKIYLPLLQAAVFASISSGISLGFKVGVMAEILGQTPFGIGRQMNLCKISMDMTGVFAWTGWIILLLLIIEMILHLVMYKKEKVQ